MKLGQMLLGKEILSYKQPMPVHYFRKSNKKPTSLQKNAPASMPKSDFFKLGFIQQ